MLPNDGKMHFSNLKNYGQSPAHYVVSCDSGFSDSSEKRIGRAVHALFLQQIEPTVYAGAVRRGKDWDAFVESSQVKKEDILNQSEYSDVVACVESLKQNKVAVELLDGCAKEKKIEWVRDGIPCCGTVDAYNNLRLIELKTCACSKPRKFLWDAHKFSYHAQMSWYDIGLGTQFEQYGTKWRDQYIIAVETSVPYSVIVYKLDNLRIDQGHILCEEWLARHKECQERGLWPSYVEDQPVTWDGEIIIEEEEV